MTERVEKCDVLIAGAGMAGITAALDLSREGAKVVVAEARDRKGGRTHNRKYRLDNGEEINLDVGAQWIGTIQENIMDLADHYGMELVPTPEKGRPIYVCDGQRVDDLAAIPEIGRVFDHVDALAAQVLPEAPWKHPQAAALDKQTFWQWLEENADPSVRKFIDVSLTGAFEACAARETSALDIFHYIRHGGGIKPLIDCEGGAQEFCLVGGPEALVNKMANDLPEGSVHLGEAVTFVAETADGVEVHTTLGRYVAKQAIITAPPRVALDTIKFANLPPQDLAMLQQMEPGSAWKFQAIYDEPWWNAEGLSGVSLHDKGIETFDNSKHGRGNMVMFGYGRASEALQTMIELERQQWAEQHLVRMFGRKALQHHGLIWYNWTADPLTKGCFSAHMKPGFWTAHQDHWLQTSGRVLFAGAERAPRVWRGYLAGAIDSAHYVSRQALSQL